MSLDEETIIIIVIIGIIFVIILLVTCVCAYLLWRKNQKLVKEHKKEEQPLNNGMEEKDAMNSNRHNHHTPGTNHNTHQPPMDIHTMGGPTHSLHNPHNNTAPYPQEDTLNSSVPSTATHGWDGYDVNFLVHPEQYQSTSQGSNSGNGSGGKYTPKRNYHPQPLSTATVTISTSFSGPQQQQPHLATPNPNPKRIPPHVQELHRKIQEQKHKLAAIIHNPNARNKLQLIDSKHISFEYEIGRGKFGKVFRALWTDTMTKQQKTVAVKWFKQDEVDQEVFEDFLKEISVAAHLPPHENVLQIYGFCISPYALVTEYVNGGSVEICVSSSNNASRRRELSIGDIVQMFIDTARGISHLHTVNIIHRDVAARNLLIEDLDNDREERGMSTISENDNNTSTRYRVDRRVVVCDFGLSRITQNPDSDNVTNSHVGPLKWMSPESIRQQIYNSKTDVYSFGVVMWEVLCGMPPYPQTKVLSLAVQVISQQTRPYVLSWFPRPLQILMQRCWQEIPEFRPTFEDIKNELDMFKQILIDNKSWNDALITHSAHELRSEKKTKEKQRSLHDLVHNYLDPNKHNWDRLIQPKLIKLMRDYEEGQLRQRQRPPLLNNMSEPDYDYNAHNSIADYVDTDNSIAIVQQMNVSNKRINDAAEEQQIKISFDDNVSNNISNNILPLQRNTSLSAHPKQKGQGHSADVSVSIHHAESLPMQRNTSLSPNDTPNMNNMNHSSYLSTRPTFNHRLGDSVQIDASIDLQNIH